MSGWPQFHVHLYSWLLLASNNRPQIALHKLKQDAILRTPRDIELFAFANKADQQIGTYRHNKGLVNATQSNQHIMDIIDQKFEILKERIYKLGIEPMQFKAMVESNSLFEWSSEVALSLSSKFCNWVVEEEPFAEDDTTTIADRQKLSIVQVDQRNSFFNNSIISHNNSNG